MSRTQLADSRNPMTMDDAERDLQELAHIEARTKQREADAEIAIATIKSNLIAANEPDALAREALEQRLLRYVEANPDKFIRPRARKTEFGEFGRRKSTRLEIEDEEAAMASIEAQGIQAIETKRTINKAALKAALEDGKTVDGAELQTGEFSYYTVAKSFLKKVLALDLTA